MTPSEEERLATLESQMTSNFQDHKRNDEAHAMIEGKLDSIYEKFNTYLPRWVTAVGMGLGMALGSSFTVIAILVGMK